ncbi:SAM-dependent methyltransferase [Azospirillum thermophilum]|uniref:Class I SAM-dependent methyltransferase n=1 Tax=Azospirillum thermophilum TaxID=2202148 RepID=A0A2S2CTN9_9PROT|nr:class I SAM-dependent methyltransferase [Azospirillum thermophilum]AWK87740.1 class I SAM-dependent methyltransferase [Azospirillum thermophilum]
MQREIERWRNPDWRARLEAWWEGYDLADLQRRIDRMASGPRSALRPVESVGTAAHPHPAGTAAAVEASAVDYERLSLQQLDRQGEPVWSPARAEGAQLLWGDDQVGPSDAQWMVDSVRSFGLNPAKSVLDLSAGLGGTARALVNSYDTWVTGLEASPVLAKMAMERSKALGLAKKAPVAHYDPEQFNQAGSFDLVMADRVVHGVRDKDGLLDRIADCVKPRGGILLFDYVIEGTPGSWDNWNGWRSEEPLEVYPWTGTRLADELSQRNLDLRVCEDLTRLHRRQIIERVRRLGETLQQAVPGARVLSALARELSLWWMRLKVLGSGLRFFRYVAVKPA